MPFSGKHINVRIGSVPVQLVGIQMWTADDNTQELDATTAADLGFGHPDFGVQTLSVSMQLVIDILAGVLVTVQSNTQLTNLGLWATLTATQPIYLVPTFNVFKSTPKGEINGRFTYDVSGKSVGPYTFNNPSG
jgi:hypothetical protein